MESKFGADICKSPDTTEEHLVTVNYSRLSDWFESLGFSVCLFAGPNCLSMVFASAITAYSCNSLQIYTILMKSYHASCILSESQASCTQGIMRTLCLSGQRSNWCNLSVAFSPFPSSAKAQDRRRSEWFRRTCVTKCSRWRDFDRTKTDEVHKAPEASSQKAAGRYASMKIMESRYMRNLLDPRHLAHHILRLLLCYRLLLPGLFSPKGLDIRGQARQLQSPVANLLQGVWMILAQANWIRIYCTDVNDLSQNGHDVGVHSWHRPIVCTIKPHFASRAHGRASIPHQFQVVHFHALSPSHINKLAQTLISILISISSMQSKTQPTI